MNDDLPILTVLTVLAVVAHTDFTVKMIFDCCMSVKAEAEMRRREMKERRFIAKKMRAGTAIGRLVAASRRACPRTAATC